MKKTIMVIIKLILLGAILFGLYVAATIAYAYFTDYQPEPEEEIEVIKGSVNRAIDKDEFVFYDWNIGYCGLGAESDFFYDGGKMVRPKKDLTQKNLDGVLQTVKSWTSDADFILLQEVDVKSKRSYKINELDAIQKTTGYNAVLGVNYDVKYVPLPFTNPMGKVLGGIVSLFPYQTASEPIRVQFPSNFSFPKGLFFLDRCFVKHRFNLKNGKQLIVINTHNSAYDGGKLKIQEMEYFKKYIVDEYNLGNYVIVGGDWNQIPPGYTPKDANSNYEEMPIPEGYVDSNWTWAFDINHATNRKVDKPYVKDKSYTTIIDFYLLSPNIELIAVEGLPNDFAFSDHQPVKMKCKLKPYEN
ncbi:MAG: endonuclease/exonuclease/phosphatase family protein [Chitinophagales bacterium]|nr:endonuclease/exonuclease/phosphatase family protein [Chitinophagales bacterium]